MRETPHSRCNALLACILQKCQLSHMKILVPSISFLILILVYNSCSPQAPAPQTVSKLDKDRYAGEWHEIARLPNTFEKGLVAATATYGVNRDGTISVRNDGLKEGGETTSIEGTAKPVKDGEPGKLEVRFDRFPANLFAGDYWILDVDSGYRRALVGSPDRKFLWLLSKNPSAKRSDFDRQIEKAEELGYDTSELFFNPKRISN